MKRLMRNMVFLLLFVFCVTTNALALSKLQLGCIKMMVVHNKDKKVKEAYQLLLDKKVLMERAEQEWDLATVYPGSSHPDIAEAISVLQEAEILEVKPINWQGTDNAIELLIDGEEIYERAVQMIERAQRTIRFNMFLWGGSVGHRVMEAMVKAQERGVSVQIITMPTSWLDRITTPLQNWAAKNSKDNHLPVYKGIKEEAKAAGLRVAEYPVGKLNKFGFSKADHNKLLSIDSTEALVGGMNFADCIAKNHDIMLWISGPAVLELEETFADNWRFCGEKDPLAQQASPCWTDERLLSEATKIRGRAIGRVTCTYSNAVKNATRKLVEDAIDNAEKKIRIIMFVLTDDAIVDKIIAAHERGVDVMVLVDPNCHAFGMKLPGLPNLTTVRQLKKAGITVKAYKAQDGYQCHIKAGMFDDKYTIVGSTNWTTAGFDCNAESLVGVESKDLAADFQALFDLDWEQSYEFKSDGIGRFILSVGTEALDFGF